MSNMDVTDRGSQDRAVHSSHQQQQQIMAYRTAQLAHHMRRLSEASAAVLAPLVTEFATYNANTAFSPRLSSSISSGSSDNLATPKYTSEFDLNPTYLPSPRAPASFYGAGPSVAAHQPIHNWKYPSCNEPAYPPFTSQMPFGYSVEASADLANDMAYAARNPPVYAPYLDLFVSATSGYTAYGYGYDASATCSNPPSQPVNPFSAASPDYCSNTNAYVSTAAYSDNGLRQLDPSYGYSTGVTGAGLGIDPMQLSTSVPSFNGDSTCPLSTSPSVLTPRSNPETPCELPVPERPVFRRHSDSTEAVSTQRGRKRKSTWSAGKHAEWEAVADKRERRKMQNRLAQRAFRARCKKNQVEAEAGGL